MIWRFILVCLYLSCRFPLLCWFSAFFHFVLCYIREATPLPDIKMKRYGYMSEILHFKYVCSTNKFTILTLTVSLNMFAILLSIVLFAIKHIQIDHMYSKLVNLYFHTPLISPYYACILLYERST